jgi:hypothetical protein
MAKPTPAPPPAAAMRPEAVIRDLKALAAKLQRPIEAADVRRRTRLVGAIAAAFGDLSSALRAAGLPEAPEDQRVIWGPERVLDAIRTVPRGAKVPLALGKHARRLFGSVVAARVAAGVEVLRTRRTRDEVIAALQAHGGSQLPRVLIKACLTHFGSVSAGRRAAGVESNHKKWTAARVLDALRCAPAGTLRPSLEAGCEKFFGSVAAAREAAARADPSDPARARGGRPRGTAPGAPFDARTTGRKTVADERQPPEAMGDEAARARAIQVEGGLHAPTRREVVVRELQALATTLARPIGPADLIERGRLARRIARTFGELSTALRAAALPASPDPTVPVRETRRTRPRWTATGVLEALQAVAAKGGAVPEPLRRLAVRHFGSLAEARARIGVAALMKTWDRDVVLRELQALGGRGADPNLTAACRRWFGSVRAARRAAAVPMRAEWSREAVLAEIQRRGGERGSPQLHDAANHYFGGWRQAWAAAGVTPRWQPRTPRRWTRAAIVAELRRIGGAGGGKALGAACVAYFGSVAAARAAAGVPAAAREKWTQAATLEEVRQRGGRRIAGSVAHACRRHFGSIGAARIAAGVDGPARGRDWSPERVVTELRAQPARGASPAVRSYATKYFGSVAQARAAAGLPPVTRTWTREALIAELQRADQAGEPLGGAVHRASKTVFGSVAAAQQAAGVAVRRRAWTKPEALAALRAAQAQGTPMSSSLKRGCTALFGSMSAARTAAGVPVLRTKWTRDRVLAALRGEGVPDAVSAGALIHAAQTWFGSVSAARAAAGLEPVHTTWSREVVLARLRERGDTPGDVNLSAACQRYFGSVNAARAAAGVTRLRVAAWTDAALVEEVRRIGEGRMPEKLMTACGRRFGSVDAARRVAGLPPRRRHWTRDEVLAHLRQPGGHTGVRGSLYRACIRHFGSLDAARRAADDPSPDPAGRPPGRDPMRDDRATRDVVDRGDGVVVAAAPRAPFDPPRAVDVVDARAKRPADQDAPARDVARGRPRHRWTRDEVLAHLRETGGTIGTRWTLRRRCIQCFGSVAAARRAAGIDAPGDRDAHPAVEAPRSPPGPRARAAAALGSRAGAAAPPPPVPRAEDRPADDRRPLQEVRVGDGAIVEADRRALVEARVALELVDPRADRVVDQDEFADDAAGADRHHAGERAEVVEPEPEVGARRADQLGAREEAVVRLADAQGAVDEQSMRGHGTTPSTAASSRRPSRSKAR